MSLSAAEGVFEEANQSRKRMNARCNVSHKPVAQKGTRERGVNADQKNQPLHFV